MSDGAFTHDVFLSHSSKDKAVVRLLAERLPEAVRKHLKVWFDEWELPVAADWRPPGEGGPPPRAPTAAKIEEGPHKLGIRT